MPLKVNRKVIKGSRLGSKIGAPTANVRLYRKDKIKLGVWATASKVDKKFYPSVTHVGTPQVEKNQAPAIETFIINFEDNLYNENIEIIFLQWLRQTQPFDNKDNLLKQIKKDIKLAASVYKKFQSKS